jgi:ABC-type methionine transport system ATPase subunit
LDFPIDRLYEPIFTRLVKEFDVAPNLLSADIDSQKGGWLILEIQGDDGKMDLALDWVRSRGISIEAIQS